MAKVLLLRFYGIFSHCCCLFPLNAKQRELDEAVKP